MAVTEAATGAVLAVRARFTGATEAVGRATPGLGSVAVFAALRDLAAGWFSGLEAEAGAEAGATAVADFAGIRDLAAAWVTGEAEVGAGVMPVADFAAFRGFAVERDAEVEADAGAS